MMVCKNGVCARNKKELEKKKQQEIAAQKKVAPAVKSSVLPQQLRNNVAVPAVPNAAKTGIPGMISNAQRGAPTSPLRNYQKENYKMSPYLRGGDSSESEALKNALAAGFSAAEIASAGGPWAMAAAGLLGAGAAGGSSVMNKIKNWSINNKVKHHVKALNKWLSNPKYANDPRYQEKIRHSQERLNELAPGKLAPGQEKLPVEQQQQIIDRSVSAANSRGSGANYEGKPGFNSQDGQGGQNGNSVQLSRYTEPQVGLQNSLINRLQNNPANFGNIQRDELRRHQTETHPQALEQAYGKNPYQSGSGQEYQLQKSSEGLAERLAAMQSKFELQQEGNYLQSALQPTFENIYKNPAAPETPFWQNILARSGPAAIESGAQAFGNWMNKGKDQPQQQATNVSQQYQAPAQQISAPNAMTEGGAQYSAWDPQVSKIRSAEQEAIGANALREFNARNHQLGGGQR